MKQAAELAVFEANKQGFQLVVKDTKGTPEGAVAAATSAVSEGAELLLGPLTSGGTKAVKPILARTQTPAIAFSNDRSAAAPGVYLMSFLVRQEVDRIIAYAASKGHRRFAALISSNAYGKVTEAAFREAVARNGGQIAALEHYSANAARLLEPTQRLIEAIKLSEASGQPIDAVFLPGGPATLPNLGPLLTRSNVDGSRIRLLGTGGWDQASLAQNKAFVGGWFAAPDPRGWHDFSRRFVAAYAMSPPRIATLAYDAVTAAIHLSTGPKGQRFSAEKLTRPEGFKGIDGPVRLLPDGTVQRSLAILEVQPGGVRVIEPPSSAIANGRTANKSAGFGYN